MNRSVALAISQVGTTSVEGRFERHVSPKNRLPLKGSNSGGRWGPENAYSVLYLGRPRDSVVVEAYRHLVEAIDGMKPEMVGPRRCVACHVQVTNVLDLRNPENQERVGLKTADLLSDVGAYDACHRIGRAVHQLQLHGIIAPAATGLGETLALFEQWLPAEEQPTLVETSDWDGLPADPR